MDGAWAEAVPDPAPLRAPGELARAAPGPWAASRGPISRFIMNGSAGHGGNFYISVYFIINGFPELWQPTSHTTHHKYLIRHLQSAIYHL